MASIMDVAPVWEVRTWSKTDALFAENKHGGESFVLRVIGVLCGSLMTYALGVGDSVRKHTSLGV